MKKPRRMPKQERQGRILAELRVSTTLRISDLATELGVSTETIRRDLEEMGQSGLINRTYGGAVARPFGYEPAWNERSNAMASEREAIAAYAIQLIQPGEVLMIDAGSTTLHFARRLAAELRDLTVITNSFAVATALGTNPAMTVIVAPGRYDVHEGGLTGPDTLTFLQRFNANHTIIGASGLTEEGPNEANSGATAVKRAMLARAQDRILLLDHSKYGQPSLEVICPPAGINRLVTDKAPPKEIAQALRGAGVEVYC
jgi:DeoR/GlpR family transcriptional regulator of sugar metabolism